MLFFGKIPYRLVIRDFLSLSNEFCEPISALNEALFKRSRGAHNEGLTRDQGSLQLPNLICCLSFVGFDLLDRFARACGVVRINFCFSSIYALFHARVVGMAQTNAVSDDQST